MTISVLKAFPKEQLMVLGYEKSLKSDWTFIVSALGQMKSWGMFEENAQ